MCPVLASLPFLILFLVIYGINWVLRKRKHPPDGNAVLITGMNVSHLLTLCLLVSSADNLSKRFGPRSGQTFCRAWSGSKLLTLWWYSWKIFLGKKLILKKIGKRQKQEKLHSMQRVNYNRENKNRRITCQFVSWCSTSQSTFFCHARTFSWVLSSRASTQVNLSSEVCEQQRHRPACVSAQSDQRLCYSLFWKVPYIILLQAKFQFSS